MASRQDLPKLAPVTTDREGDANSAEASSPSSAQAAPQASNQTAQALQSAVPNQPNSPAVGPAQKDQPKPAGLGGLLNKLFR